MALHPFPLTRERFLIACRRRTNTDNPFKDVDDSVIDYWCEQTSDRVQSALGDRATLPLLQWDAALEGAAVSLTHYAVLCVRGFDPRQGADVLAKTRADEAEAYLARLRPGGPTGKSENPRFVDSGQNVPRDAGFIISQTNSMAALLGPCRRGR